MENINITQLFAIQYKDFFNFTCDFIHKSETIKKSIISTDDFLLSVSHLLNDTYEFNLIMGYVSVMMLVSKDPLWYNLDEKLNDHLVNFYNDTNFAKKINMIINHYTQNPNLNQEHTKFLEKVISKFNTSKKIAKVDKSINIIQERIYNTLSHYQTLKIAKKYISIEGSCAIEFDQSTNQNNIASLLLTPKNYDRLVEHIESTSVRSEIETKYKSKTNLVLCDFAKLIVLRREFALLKGFGSYFKYMNNGKYDNTDTIKELIMTLNKKIETKSIREVKMIYNYFMRSYGSNDKHFLLMNNDITKYKIIHKNATKYAPAKVLDVIFMVAERYFNVSFKINNKRDIKLWNNNIIVYEASSNDSNQPIKLGNIYVDLYKSQSKNIDVPIAIKISDKFILSDGKYSQSEVALLGNYENTECMSYGDVILLFKEFGYVLQNIAYISSVGLINYDEEFSNFLPLVMECFALDREIIGLILNCCDTQQNYSKHIIDHIELEHRQHACFSLKLKCIDAKFDHIIHNSPELIDILKEAEKNNEDQGLIILKLYQNIYSEAMSNFDRMINTKIQYIEPRIIMQELNNLQGVLYSNLMNDIFAYVTYWSIKVKGRKDFRDIVLKNGTQNYRELIRNFIKRENTDCFQLFLSHIVEQSDHHQTEDTNYFDEKCSETEQDQSNITKLRKT